MSNTTNNDVAVSVPAPPLHTSSSSATATEQTLAVRHGPGDAVLKLNIGGKEFTTLRSTVESNAVLHEYVMRAEANGELTNGNAFFIDRDPAQFGLILTYLRNRMDGIAYNNRSTFHNYGVGVKLTMNKKPKYLRLPDKEEALQDLYVEATHYRLTDLQEQLCQTSLVTAVTAYFGGGGNPFEQAQSVFRWVRRSLFGLVGTGSIMGAIQADIDWLMTWLPWVPGTNETETDPNKKKDKNVVVGKRGDNSNGGNSGGDGSKDGGMVVS